MHSFRLRYVVLGLLIYLQNAFCRTCGSEFEDIASKAVVASTVFEGTVVDKSVNITSSQLYNATFNVIKTFKGDLPKEKREYLDVTVGVFGPENQEQCNTHVEVGSHYIVFLNPSQEASLYTISNFPELSTKTSKRELRKILCDDNIDSCAIPVKARLRPTSVTVKEGRSLSLRCKAEGFPPPMVEWYLDDHPIKPDRRISIRNRKGVSKFRIRRTRLEHSGRYQCVVHNALGERMYQESQVTIESDDWTFDGQFYVQRVIATRDLTQQEYDHSYDGSAEPDSVTSKTPSHAIRCESQAWCLNGGTCWQVPSPNNKWEQFCKCTDSYIGARCQEKEPEIFSRPDIGPRRDARQFDRWMTILGITIGVLVLLIVLLAAYCKAKQKRRAFRARQAEKKRTRRELQDAYTNGKHRPQSRDERQSGGAGEGGVNKAEPPPFSYLNFSRLAETTETGIQTDTWPRKARSPCTPPAGPDPGTSLNPGTCPPQLSSMLASLPSPHGVAAPLDAFVANLESGNIAPYPPTVVSAVVETERDRNGPNSSRSSPNQSQTSRTESAHQPLDLDDSLRKFSDPDLIVAPNPTNNRLGQSGMDIIGIDPDSQSECDNKSRASDLEVNIESEVDANRLDSSEDDSALPLHGGVASPHDVTDDSDSDSSSSCGEEHVLFQSLSSKKRPPTPPKPSTNNKSSPAAVAIANNLTASQHEPLLANYPTQTPINDKSPTFNPYASDALDGNYFGNFGDSFPSTKRSFSRQSGFSGKEMEFIDSLLFDPDPDATPV